MKNLIFAAIVTFSFSSVFTGCVTVPEGEEPTVRKSPPKKTAVDRAQEYHRRGNRGH